MVESAEKPSVNPFPSADWMVACGHLVGIFSSPGQTGYPLLCAWIIACTFSWVAINSLFLPPDRESVTAEVQF